jgi:putative hemolysin
MIKRLLLAAVVLCTSVSITCSQGLRIANPASAYARFMGLKSKVRTDSLGNQLRVCILPDSTECDEWAFFRGKCGNAFSYCALKGCTTETDTAGTSEFAVCVYSDSLGRTVRVPLLDFMVQHGDTLIKDNRMRFGGKR